MSSQIKERLALVLLVAFLVVATVQMSGCVAGGVERPAVNNPDDAIIVTAVDIANAARSVRLACGNTVPGGDCRLGAPITTEQKNGAKDRLQEAQNALVLSNQLLGAGQAIDADDKLALVEAILLEIAALLPQESP